MSEGLVARRSDALVARQPIFDRRMNVVAYELLFRDGTPDAADQAEAEKALAEVVLNTLIEIGVDRIVGGKDAWLEVSREFILGGFATLLPAERFVLGVPDHAQADTELIVSLRELADQGYRFAVKVSPEDPNSADLLRVATYAKLDLQTGERDQFKRELENVRKRGVKVLAEELETDTEHRFCIAAGADLFQGCFYSRPQTVGAERVDTNRVALLQLLAQLQEPDVELEELERAIAADPRLSYRLLRYINSAFVGLGREVRSIRQAVVMMGVDNMKRWATLSLFTMVDDKPVELTRTALTRGRYCELAAGDLNGGSGGELFTVGLLSVLDALLDLPLEAAMSEMPLASDIVEALLGHAGIYGPPLQSVLALESGDVKSAEALVPEASMRYLEAIVWADAAADALTA